MNGVKAALFIGCFMLVVMCILSVFAILVSKKDANEYRGNMETYCHQTYRHSPDSQDLRKCLEGIG